MTDGTSESLGHAMDARMKTALVTVLAVGAACTAFLALGWGARPAVSAGAGATIATANLYALARILGALLTPRAATTEEAPRRSSVAGWAILAGIKMTILFGGMWLLMRRGYVDALPLIIGYGSLPIGIAVGSIVSDRTGAARS